MKKIIPLDISCDIEFDNIRALSTGNNADVYHAHVKHREKVKKKRFFICSKYNDDDQDFKEYEDIIIKITKPHKKSRCVIENEIQILLELENEPNIIHIKKHVTSCIYKNWEFIGLEYCKGGDLFEYFKKRNFSFKEDDIKIIFPQLINAINACHRHHIVHGDIKLENIGLVRQDDISELKLLDFGGSYKIEHPNDETMHRATDFNLTASPHYIPPELVNTSILIKESELIYADFWELGVVCFVLLTGSFPFGNIKSKFSRIKKCIIYDEVIWPKNSDISPDMKKFVNNLLKKKPQERHLEFFN